MQMRKVGGDDLVSRTLSFIFLVSLCMFSASIGQVADEEHPTKIKFLGDHFLAFGAIALTCSILKSIRLAWNEPRYMDMVRYPIPINLIMVLTYVVISLTKISVETQVIVYLTMELVVVSFNLYSTFRSKSHVHPEYMNERVGVFLIVMLGEIVAAIVSAHGNTTGEFSDNFASSIMGAVVVFGIWWLYFESVPNPDVYNHSTRTTFSWFTHFALFVSISILSGSLVVVLTACDTNGLDTEISHDVADFLLGSTAIVHFCLKIVGVRIVHHVYRSRVSLIKPHLSLKNTYTQLLYCWDGHFRSTNCLLVIIYSSLQCVLLGMVVALPHILSDYRANVLLGTTWCSDRHVSHFNMHTDVLSIYIYRILKQPTPRYNDDFHYDNGVSKSFTYILHGQIPPWRCSR